MKITEEWLLAKGFKWAERPECYYLDTPAGSESLLVYRTDMKVSFGGRYHTMTAIQLVCLCRAAGIPIPEHEEPVTGLPHIKTRGDLYRLQEALGVCDPY